MLWPLAVWNCTLGRSSFCTSSLPLYFNGGRVRDHSSLVPCGNHPNLLGFIQLSRRRIADADPMLYCFWKKLQTCTCLSMKLFNHAVVLLDPITENVHWNVCFSRPILDKMKTLKLQKKRQNTSVQRRYSLETVTSTRQQICYVKRHETKSTCIF